MSFLLGLFGAISSIESLAKLIDSVVLQWAAYRKAQKDADISKAQSEMNKAKTGAEVDKAADDQSKGW